MGNVSPLFSFQHPKPTNVTDLNQPDIQTLKSALDVYRLKAKEYSKENAALRMLVSHYKEALTKANLNHIALPSETSSKPSLYDFHSNEKAEASKKHSELSVLSELIRQLQLRHTKIERELMATECY